MNFKSMVAIAAGVGVLILVLTLNPFANINAGERGVVTTWGAVEDYVLEEGIHYRTPVAQHIIPMNVQTQKIETDADSASKDLQTVYTTVALNFHLQPDQVNKLYQEVGKEYEDVIISPAIQESVKAATAQFTAEELITKRPKVKEMIRDELKMRLEERYILLDEFSIVNFAFSEQFASAIEAKQTAEQQAQKAENDLRRIEVEARQQVEQAKAEAESIRIQAQAIKENKDLIELKAVEKWDGKLPVYMLGGDAVPFLNIGQQE